MITDASNSAYISAEKFANSHYENFPVVSFFLPKELRKHVAVVYQFARQADDIADEGSDNIETRMKKLEQYERQLKNCLDGSFDGDFWIVLAETIASYKLTPKYFFDLLSAFKQDVVKTRYETFDDILDYCERSANPVGRIILEFYDIRDKETVKYSDAVCTALQLTNFYQDISIDIGKNRIYIPLKDLNKYEVTESAFFIKKNNDNFKRMLEYQVDRAKLLFAEGYKIIRRLPKKLRFQIRLTILGGEEILKKIEKSNYNTLVTRPRLYKTDYIKLFIKALLIK